MKATHLKSLTYTNDGHAVLVITPAEYPQLPAEQTYLTKEQWSVIDKQEAEEIWNFLKQTFAESTLQKLKKLL